MPDYDPDERVGFNYETDGLDPESKSRGGRTGTFGGGSGPGAGGGFGFGGGGVPRGFSPFLPHGEANSLSPLMRRLMMLRMRRRGGMAGMGMGMGMRGPAPMPIMPTGMGTKESPVPFASGGLFGKLMSHAQQQKQNRAQGLPVVKYGQTSASGFNPQTQAGVNNRNPGFDASNPWGWLTGQTRNDWTGQGERQIGKAGEMGYFDPGGSAAIKDAARRRALQAGDAARKRASLTSDVYGLDPSQRAFGNLQTDLNAQGAVARIGADTDLEEMRGAQDYYRGMFGDYLGNEMGANMRGLDAAIGRDAQRRANKGGFGAAIGGLVGNTLGGWASPGGWFGGEKK